MKTSKKGTSKLQKSILRTGPVAHFIEYQGPDGFGIHPKVGASWE
jgi:hypothetical protein